MSAIPSQVAYNVAIVVAIGIVAILVTSSLTRLIGNFLAPKRESNCVVVGKRSQIYRYPYLHTAYFVTFQLQDETRVEFAVDGSSFGRLIEGDRGLVVYGGEWLRRFERR